MLKPSLLGIITIVLFGGTYVISAPVRSVDLAKSVKQADLIVIGRVLAVDEIGSTSVDVPGAGVVPATQFRSSLKVDQVLKGDFKSPSLVLEFYVPEYPLGLKAIHSGQYAIFILKKAPRFWAFLDPANPDLPAVPNGESISGALLDRVTAAVAQVLSSADSTDRDRFRALDVLGRLRTSFAKDLLRQALVGSSGDLRLNIARTLVARDDTFGLSVVADALSELSNLPENLVVSLASSLRGMKDPGAVPNLSRLAALKNSVVRLGAAVALRQTASPSAIQPLSRLLTDTNSDVLYYAVVGLGEITHQDEWTPAMDEFRNHEARYLMHWRAWASQLNSD